MKLEKILSNYIETENGCHEWNSAIQSGGYGVVNYQDKDYLIHRLIYKLKVAPIKEGEVIRHTCDNRLCMNPDHLLAGSQADNMRDMIERRRDRKAKGNEHYNAKLNEVDVETIRNMLRFSRASQSTIGKLYGVCQMTISKIKTNKSWKI